MGGEKDEETQTQNKIPLVPLSLACSFAKLLDNLGLPVAHQCVAEVGDRDGGGLRFPSAPFPPGAPAGP